MRELALLLALATPVPAVPAAQHLPAVAVRAPAAVLTLQVAKTELQRELGLMGVTALPEHVGMLFVFPQDGPVAFWMKDTLIPLDMIFVGNDWKVRSVAARVPTVPATMPDENIPLQRGTAKYVIELSAGEASQDGIVPGVRLDAVALHGR